MGVVFVVVPIVVVVLVLVWFFSADQQIRRRLRNAPRVDIAALGDGQEARVVGRVVPMQTMAAPLSGRPCVFYDITVEQYRSNGRSSGSWHTILRERRGVPFLVEDGSGRALVDPEGAQIAVVHDSTTRSGTLDDASPQEEALLARHGLKSQGWVLNKRLRYNEGVFEPGETVAVLGAGVREPDPSAVAAVQGYREALPTRLRLGGSQRFPLHLSDHRDTTT